jgi:hypothetical protein
VNTLRKGDDDDDDDDNHNHMSRPPPLRDIRHLRGGSVQLYRDGGTVIRFV